MSQPKEFFTNHPSLESVVIKGTMVAVAAGGLTLALCGATVAAEKYEQAHQDFMSCPAISPEEGGNVMSLSPGTGSECTPNDYSLINHKFINMDQFDVHGIKPITSTAG